MPTASTATGLLAGAYLARQAGTALAYTRAQLGYTNRAPLYERMRPGHAVLEVGPGEGHCHSHWPAGLRYTAVDLPSTGAPPPLPIEETAASTMRLHGTWQQVLPELAGKQARFDAVVMLLPSTILAGANEGGLLWRTALRWQRPRLEWQDFARDVHALLRPAGTLLVADVTAQHGWLPRLLLPYSQWRPALGVDELRSAGFEHVEVVREPSSVLDEPELLLRATREGGADS